MPNIDFVVNKAPDDVTPFDVSQPWSHKMVDYAGHPAYQQYVSQASPMLRLKAFVQFVRSMVPLLIKRSIRYEMIPREIREPKTTADFGRLAKVAFRNLLGLHEKVTPAAGKNAIYQKMTADGCAVITFDDSTLKSIMDVANLHFERLEQQRSGTKSGEREFEESRGSVDARDYGVELYDTLNAVLHDTGMIDAVSMYLGRKANLIDVNPQINDASDSFWRNIFPDQKDMSLPKSAYVHRDASGGDLKAIFYMTDVGPDNGPFSYVVGSNRLKVSKLDDLIAEANDHNGLSSTKPDARERFAALPSKLKQKGSMGNDVLDKSPLADRISNGLWQITAPKGSIVLFDTKGMHRGGMVVEGERRVITTVVG
jgi:hypothetical protein